ncbi:hypothetical protein [Microbacterium aurantiacum]|uniref:hypothetical protein n=1 Tax=Microbacterium aurantiacum TaxID=162393 RepID=UPI00342B3EF0
MTDYEDITYEVDDAAAITNICLAHARDVVLELRSGVTPRTEILRGALEQRDPARFPTLARIAELPVTTYDRQQLVVSIDLFIAGAQSVLQRQGVEELA